MLRHMEKSKPRSLTSANEYEAIGNAIKIDGKKFGELPKFTNC